MNDLRFAIRQLRQSPGFTFIAILTLALGISANTAIFSVVDAVLLKPLPFPDPTRLIAFGAFDKHGFNPAGRLNTISFPEYLDVRERNRSFAQLAAYREKGVAFSEGTEVQNLRGQHVSGNFFAALGIPPALGRTFDLEDEKAGGGTNGLSVVLSHEFWQRQFHGDRSVLGRQITLDRQPFTIIGVMPRGFQYPIQAEPSEVYITTAIDCIPSAGRPPLTAQRDNGWLRSIGRLLPKVSLAEASADLHAQAALLEKQYPVTNTNQDYLVRPLREQLVGNVRVALLVLSGAVACVLLIACVNVANLLLARASSRQREIALRMALGASRGRIVRQLLTESLLLALVGGGLGVVLALWGTQGLLALVPKEIPRAASIQLNSAVLFFTLLISAVTGIVFGLAPALQATRLDCNAALKASARGLRTGGQRSRLGRALVISEIALALIVLVGAGLLLQSFARLGQVRPGMQTARLLTARVTLPDVAYPRPEMIVRFYDQLITRLRATPGVQAASTTFPLPLSGSVSTTSFDRADHPFPSNQRPSEVTQLVGSDYFQAMGIPLLRGRGFTASDRLGAKPVVIVNERFAAKYFPGANPVGKQIKPSWAMGNEPPQMREIIGVAGNAKHLTLRDDCVPEMYLPVAQIGYPTTTILLRTENSNPAAMTNALRKALAQIDPGVPLTAVRAFDDYRSLSLGASRFNALLLSIFAGLALLLAAIGVYGVIAYSVAQRTGEIGVRMALGAQRSAILRLILGEGMRIIAFSLVLGCVGAFLCARFLRGLLYEVAPGDPATFLAIAFLLAITALLACWLPARRASQLNPIEALRSE